MFGAYNKCIQKHYFIWCCVLMRCGANVKNKDARQCVRVNGRAFPKKKKEEKLSKIQKNVE